MSVVQGFRSRNDEVEYKVTQIGCISAHMWKLGGEVLFLLSPYRGEWGYRVCTTGRVTNNIRAKYIRN